MTEVRKILAYVFDTSRDSLDDGISGVAERLAKAPDLLEALIATAREEGRKEDRAEILAKTLSEAGACFLCHASKGDEHQDWCLNK